MSNLIKSKGLYALLFTMALTTSGCGLAPKEEVLPDAPVIQEIAVEGYKMVEVMRGDMIETVTVEATYTAFRLAKLGFDITGIRYDHMYVDQGDHVKAGEVLADLVMQNILQQMKDRKVTIDMLMMKIAQAEETRSLAIEAQYQLTNVPDVEERLILQYENEIQNHDKTISRLMDELYIEEKRLSQQEEDVRKRQIIAEFDGVISYVYDYGQWEMSDREKNVITMFDPDTMVFVTNGKNSELFIPGKKVDIVSGDMTYQAIVLSPEELAEVESIDPAGNAVYLRIEDENNLLQNGDRGKITFVLQEKKDTLYLPETAVREEHGIQIVYVEDEGGFKSVKEVKTGMNLSGRIEIISGLNEGDSVILD